jgi:hypothetical protein
MLFQHSFNNNNNNNNNNSQEKNCMYFNSAPPKDGVTNHIITFQVPNQDNFQNSDNTQVILEQVDQISEVPVQTLTFDEKNCMYFIS